MGILENVKETSRFIRSNFSKKPNVALVLGSGWGSFTDNIEIEKVISYSEIPNFKSPKVAGHSGELVLGSLGDSSVFIMKGRPHYYEGHDIEDVTLPVRSLIYSGVTHVVLTNAAGGLNPNTTPGEFMIIEDHINMMGINPLRGPNIDEFGPRFPDQSEVYNKSLREKLSKIFEELSIPYSKGVYCGLSGPTYETPAEIRMLQVLGVGGVGMSTVPEAIVANHMGAKVCGISCITNKAAGISEEKLSHEEVSEIAKSVEGHFVNFMSKFLSNSRNFE